MSQSFIGGGAQVGRSWDTQRHYEVQNYTSIAQGTHSIKFGGNDCARSVTITTHRTISVAPLTSPTSLPRLCSAPTTCRWFRASIAPLPVNQGNPNCQSINSIESYRRALVLPSLGYTPAQVCLYGGCPYQFSLTSGTPYLHVNETDFGFFLMDDWRFRPNLTLSAGIRYEFQNHLDNYNDVAPRLGLAWSPGAGKTGRSKTVIRAGAGIFYSRFQLNSILNSERFNGTTQVNYVLTNPTFYPNVPSLSQIQQLVAAQNVGGSSHNTVTRYVVDPNLRTPTVFQSSVSFERQLPYNSTLSVNYLVNHTDRVFRSVNINTAAAHGTPNEAIAGSGTYPYGSCWSFTSINPPEPTIRTS